MDLTHKTLQFISKERLIKRGDLLLVGVSGGADSVCLLHVLLSLRVQLGIKLKVLHFNHRLRPTALRDELFVRKLAQEWEIPVLIARRKGPANPRKLSEDEARRLRFEFFLKEADACQADALVLAHHQNDLAETVLMRLLRGTGLSGLRGILAEKNMQGHRIIRPLLHASRQDIENYLKTHGLRYCVDESNKQPYYLRNKIRLKLLPELQKNYNPSVSNILLDLAYNAEADYEYLLLQAQRSFKKKALLSKTKVVFKLRAFLSEPTALRRMLLRLSYERLSSHMNQLSAGHMQEAEDLILNRPLGSVVHWPKGIRLVKRLKELSIQRE